MTTEPAYLTIPQAAAKVSVSERTIRDAIRSGDLSAFHPKINGRAMRSVRIDVAELYAWMRAGDAA